MKRYNSGGETFFGHCHVSNLSLYLSLELGVLIHCYAD